MPHAAILQTAYFLPSGELSNDQLAAELGDWSADKIFEKTGIHSRHIATADECSSDLGVYAADRLFNDSRFRREDVDFLLFCTQTPDYFLPTTACLVHERLRLRKDCGAIDINQGCSGFVYGLAMAASLVDSGTARNVLLITAETYSKFLNPRDRSVRTVFGDAAAATLIGAVDSPEPLIGPFVFGTDGAGAQNLIVKAGGMRQPLTAETMLESEDASGNWRSDANLYMNGPEIFNFTLNTIPGAYRALLEKAALSESEVDYYIFHQANKFMLDRIRLKLKLPEEKFCVRMDRCGNTVSSTIPIALHQSLESGALSHGQRVMLLGFGVGYSWAAGMMRVA